MIRLFESDSKALLFDLMSQFKADVVYADCIYEDTDFSWASACWHMLRDTGIFYLQTDYHTVAEWKIYLDKLFGKKNLVNWISVEFDWGGRSRRSFAKKTDFILMYSKTKDYKFYPQRVEIPKATAGTKLDKKGTGLKIPTDFWKDMSFSTISKERVKTEDGRNIRWQKSLKLIDRLLSVCTDAGDLVLDPFMGSGTSGVWAKENSRDYIGVEIDPQVFSIAKSRIFPQ